MVIPILTACLTGSGYLYSLHCNPRQLSYLSYSNGADYFSRRNLPAVKIAENILLLKANNSHFKLADHKREDDETKLQVRMNPSWSLGLQQTEAMWRVACELGGAMQGSMRMALAACTSSLWLPFYMANWSMVFCLIEGITKLQ